MNDDQYFLANAYLDGELTDEERRVAEADPAVMAEVDVLRALQAQLRDIQAPTDDARESAISAAMATFAQDTASPAVTASAPAIPFRPRPSYAKYLAVAAAVVAVAGLGIVISQADLGGDDDDAADSGIAAEADANEGAFAESVEATLDAAGASDASDTAAEPADEPADEAAEEPAAELAEEEPADDMADDGDASQAAEPAAEADAGADAGDDDVASSRVAVPDDFDPDAPILDASGLAVYGVYLLDERDAGRLPPSPNTPCERDDEILARALLDVGDGPSVVYIAVDDVADVVFAIEPSSCVELMVSSLR